jgi:hypothetical protein
LDWDQKLYKVRKCIPGHQFQAMRNKNPKNIRDALRSVNNGEGITE